MTRQDWRVKWQGEQVARLARLRLSAMSTSQIAAELGTTRGAVIGKLWRLRREGIDLARIAEAAAAVPFERPVTVARLEWLGGAVEEQAGEAA